METKEYFFWRHLKIKNYIERINIRKKKREKIKIDANDVCVTKTGDVYVTDRENKSIVRLSSSG